MRKMIKLPISKRAMTRAAAATLAVGLALHAPIAALAGSWSKDSVGWTYTDDNGVKAVGRWIEDGGNRYLIGADGYMKTGWQLDNGKWYFLSLSSSNGAPEGAALKGWQWIDGKCYYFAAVQDAAHPIAALYVNETTPDGYTVNTDGQWTENGTVVSVSGKGIITAVGPGQGTSTTGKVGRSSGGGGGGSSSGGGGGSSSSGSHSSSGSSGSGSSSDSSSDAEKTDEEKDTEITDDKTDIEDDQTDTGSSKNTDKEPTVEQTADYTVYCVDEQGNIINQTSGTGVIGKTVLITPADIEGYTYVSGAGERPFTKETSSFIVTYKKEAADTDTKDTAGEDTSKDTSDDKAEDAAVTYKYRYVYVDEETDGEIGYSDWSSAKANDTVTWTRENVDGYTLAGGNNLTGSVTCDEQEFIIRFKQVEDITYTITWKCDDETLFKVSGTGNAGEVIELAQFDINSRAKEPQDEITLDADGDNKYEFECLSAEIASPSEEEDLVKYTLTYKDFDTNKVLRKEEGKVERDTQIEAGYCPEGYEAASDEYDFTASEDSNDFTVSLIKSDLEDDSVVSVVSYSAICETEEGDAIREFEGSASISGSESLVTIEHAIDGYEQTGETEFTLLANTDNLITLTYSLASSGDGTESTDETEFTVYLMDASSLDTIRTDTITAAVGSYLDFTDYEAPEGYTPAGTFPDSIRVQALSSNNYVKLYFSKIADPDETVQYANWTIKYVNYDDETEEIRSSQTGSCEVGPLTVTFTEQFNKDGKIWRAVDSSPRTFTVKGNTDMNTFYVRFKQTGTIEKEDTYRTYALRYIAGDTGSVLGVKVGEGNVGDDVTIRNSWTYYTCPEEGSYTIQSDDNEVDLTYTRHTSTEPEINEHTGEYDGYEFIALFVDQYGETVFEPVRGKVRDGDTLYIDYPDVIDRDGVTYRADKSSPYKSSTGGTTYRQIEISYTRGEDSDNKLSSWLQTAQEAKNEFWGTTPYKYTVNLKEYSTKNDVGLYVGVAPKDSTVEINAVNVPGWITRQDNAVKSFTLSEDNTVVTREYDKSGGTPSTGGYEREYTISFKDEDGNNLFEPYTGTVVFARMDQKSDFYVYFPRTFVDEEGNRWRTDEESPKDVVLRCNNTSTENLHTIEYYKIYTNPKTEFIVDSDSDVRNYISDVGSAMYDSELHDFYLIGKDYDPSIAVVSETIYGYNLVGYQGAIEDTFELDGATYKVFHFRLARQFDEDTCEHSWQYVEELPGSCYVAAQTTVECSRCGATQTVYKGALGHIDYDYDRVCDVCGQQLSISIGDSITVNWDGGEYYSSTAAVSFVCIGTDADGNYVLMAEDNVTKDIFGTYAADGRGYYSTSDLKAFLNDGFADGLSVKENLIEKDGELVTILSQDEYNAYKAAAGTTYLFPDGNFILKSNEEDTVLTTKGTITVAEADDANVRPVIYLPASTSTVGAEGGSWSVDDIQARKIGSDVWLFRCVDENFEDSSATPKHLALFICDSVIPSNYEMGFGIGETEDSAGRQETRFFGSANNNYKYSIIHDWLTENTSDTGDLVKVNVGIKNEYSGSTAKGLWNRFSASSLTKHARSSSQTIYARMFIPSVEEAVSLSDYLFKFNGSDENNASDIVNNYRRGYFLRTPQYGTTDKVYYVDLVTGCISTTNATAQSEDDVCEIGIRPMYAVEQYE